MPINTHIHAVLTKSEQTAIVNALAFYNDYWAAEVEHDSDSMEQWRISFREDNLGTDNDGPVDKLATYFANLK
tara:strand:- start:664 stop:882 length:219 start_codon:yes stop_codon:yes gene_type:complete